MPIVPVRQRDRARPARAHQPDDVGDLAVVAVNPAVGPFQVDPPGGAEHRARRFRFRFPFLRRAVRAELAARQIAEADPEPERGVQRDGARQPDLDVVGMRTEYEQIDFTRRRHARELLRVETAGLAVLQA